MLATNSDFKKIIAQANQDHICKPVDGSFWLYSTLSVTGGRCLNLWVSVHPLAGELSYLDVRGIPPHPALALIHS